TAFRRAQLGVFEDVFDPTHRRHSFGKADRWDRQQRNMQKLCRSQAIAECASRMRMDGALALRANRECQLHEAPCAWIKRPGFRRCLAKLLVSRPDLRMPFGELGRSHGKLSNHVSLPSKVPARS